MASTTEAPSRAVAVLQYGLFACALFGLDRLAREIRDREMSSDRHSADLIQSLRTILKTLIKFEIVAGLRTFPKPWRRFGPSSRPDPTSAGFQPVPRLFLDQDVDQVESLVLVDCLHQQLLVTVVVVSRFPAYP